METTTIVTALGTAFGTVSANMMEAISTIMPIALPIGGAVVVIRLGWKLFKSLTK